MSYEDPTKITSNVASIFSNMGTRVNITANGGSQQVTTNSNQTPSASGSDPSGSIPGNSPSPIEDPWDDGASNKGNDKGTGPKAIEAKHKGSIGNSWEKDFGKTPWQQHKDAAAGWKRKKERLKNQRDLDLGIVKAKQQDGPEELTLNKPGAPSSNNTGKSGYGWYVDNRNQPDPQKKQSDLPTFSFTPGEKGISEEEAKQQREKIKKTYRASKNNKALIEKDDKIKVVNKNRAKRMSEKGWTETPLNFNNTMNYLDDNAQQQMDPNAAFQDPTNLMGIQPNRAGRPVNSNILTTDPNNYQDPSKVSATTNATENLFQNIASSGAEGLSAMGPFNYNDDKVEVQKDDKIKSVNPKRAERMSNRGWKPVKAETENDPFKKFAAQVSKAAEVAIPSITTPKVIDPEDLNKAVETQVGKMIGKSGLKAASSTPNLMKSPFNYGDKYSKLEHVPEASTTATDTGSNIGMYGGNIANISEEKPKINKPDFFTSLFGNKPTMNIGGKTVGGGISGGTTYNQDGTPLNQKDWMGNIENTKECTGDNYYKSSCSGRAKAFATRARSGEFHKK